MGVEPHASSVDACPLLCGLTRARALLFLQSLLLAFHSVGLAACPLNWDVPRASDEALRERLRIPESDTITMMMAVGHYAEEFTHAVSPRKPLREVLIPEEAVWKADI